MTSLEQQWLQERELRLAAEAKAREAVEAKAREFRQAAAAKAAEAKALERQQAAEAEAAESKALELRRAAQAKAAEAKALELRRAAAAKAAEVKALELRRAAEARAAEVEAIALRQAAEARAAEAKALELRQAEAKARDLLPAKLTSSSLRIRVGTQARELPRPPATRPLPLPNAGTQRPPRPWDRMISTGNSLGMKFIHFGNFSDGRKVLGCVHGTRSKDFAAFIADRSRGYQMTGRNYLAWRTFEYQGVPVGRGKEERAEDSSHPVCNVSWDDAQAFCAWLTSKERAEELIGPADEYRLPTDHEWSMMAGIGGREDSKTTPASKDKRIANVYPWGAEYPPKNKVGNYADASAKALGVSLVVPGYDDGHATTAPVMSFPAGSLGFYDLGGNAWEWCDDWYDEEHKDRVLRGASWFSGVGDGMLSSARGQGRPSLRGCDIGFRCVLVVAGA